MSWTRMYKISRYISYLLFIFWAHRLDCLIWGSDNKATYLQSLCQSFVAQDMFLFTLYCRHVFLCLGPNVPTTPIMAIDCQQCLPLSVVQLKGKHYRKPHCRNGVVDTFGSSKFNLRHFQPQTFQPHRGLGLIIWLKSLVESRVDKSRVEKSRVGMSCNLSEGRRWKGEE